MKIAVCCCTFNRPKMLGQVIRCFERQDYADREMVILDDAGQYENQQGDRWRLISVKKRFPSLAQKRNAAASLASPDAEIHAPWDDDDLYLPWALSAHAAALADAEWSRPSLVLQAHQVDGRIVLRQHTTGGLYHGGWAYTRGAFAAAGRYPEGWSGPEDQRLMVALQNRNTREADPCANGRPPAYIYDFGPPIGARHISGMLTGRDRGERAWTILGMTIVEPARLELADVPWLDGVTIEPEIYARPF
jgi:glycosyltransferase involved in cell wall biosynthesis